MLKAIGRPSVDDADDVLATIDGRSSRLWLRGAVRVLVVVISRAAVPSRPARSRRATSGGACSGCRRTLRETIAGTWRRWTAGPGVLQSAAMRAFRLRDQPGSARTTLPEFGAAPSASACRNARCGATSGRPAAL